MKFKYGDVLRVKDGFFKGVIGIAINYRITNQGLHGESIKYTLEWESLLDPVIVNNDRHGTAEVDESFCELDTS